MLRKFGVLIWDSYIYNVTLESEIYLYIKLMGSSEAILSLKDRK